MEGNYLGTVFNQLEEKSIGELIQKLIFHQQFVDDIEDVVQIYSNLDQHLHHAVECLDCCTRLAYYAKEAFVQAEHRANQVWGKNFESYIVSTPISLVRGRADASMAVLRYEANLARLQAERFEGFRELYIEKINFFKKIRGGTTNES